MTTSWSQAEVEAAVEAYFDMLQQELLGQKYNKRQRRLALIGKLNARSEGSVELKHQNISAVLIEMGIPYISGYKPRANYQRSLLPGVVSEYLQNHPQLQSLFQADSEAVLPPPTVEDFLAVMEKPPQYENALPSRVKEIVPVYNPAGVNYLEREARNQALGEAGEQFVLNFERARLVYAGKTSLADRIEQVSVTEGPAAGFDIHSFEASGKDRLIEVKTTKYGKETPFFVSPNELRCSTRHAASYHLYRLFRFRESPRLFSLQGSLSERCRLEPSVRAWWRTPPVWR
jgi:hypothetical protein